MAKIESDPRSVNVEERQELHRLVDKLPVGSLRQAMESLARFQRPIAPRYQSFYDEVIQAYPRLRKVHCFVQANYAGEISLLRAAREAGLEQKYFSAYFRKKVGICFRDWVMLVRVGHATELIDQQELTITEIAFETGFCDLRTFERAFRKCLGVTPRSLQKRADVQDHDRCRFSSNLPPRPDVKAALCFKGTKTDSIYGGSMAMLKEPSKRDTEFSVRVKSSAGCLDKVTNALTDAGARINSASCACGGGEGFATFSVSEIQPDVLRGFSAELSEIPVLNVQVRNEAGCLSRVTSSLSKAGVTIGSLACACSPNDVSGTVAIGLVPRK